VVDIWLTFNFAGIEGFLILTWGSRQDSKPNACGQEFDKAWLKAQLRRSQAIKVGKIQFQAQRWFP